LNTFINVSICQGDSFFFGNSWRSISGIYSDTLISSGGCDSVVSVALNIAPSIINNINSFICQGDSLFAGGAWQTAAGTYYDTLIASGGCDSIVITTLVVEPDFVWPGDANDDGVANNYDLLPLGIHIGSTGSPRDSVSIAWVKQCARDWGTLQSNGSDRKHTDCNGDSIVSRADTTAMSTNYTRIHPKTEESQQSSAGPVLTLIPRQSIYHPGDTVFLDVTIGDSENPVSAFYGIAFNISFDNTLVEAGTANLIFTDSWIGSVADNLRLSKVFEQSGTAEAALTRTDHQNVSGHGTVGFLQFVVKQSIRTSQATTVSFSGHAAVLSDGSVVSLNPLDTTIAIDGTSFIPSVDVISLFRIYPNPFSAAVVVEYTLSRNSNVSLKIFDAVGRILIHTQPETQAQGKHSVLVDSISHKGLFIAELNADGIKKRLMLVRL